MTLLQIGTNIYLTWFASVQSLISWEIARLLCNQTAHGRVFWRYKGLLFRASDHDAGNKINM